MKHQINLLSPKQLGIKIKKNQYTIQLDPKLKQSL